MINEVDEVINNLWLGNIEYAQDKKFIKKNNIKYVYNLTHNLYHQVLGVKYFQTQLSDSDNPKEINDFMVKVNDLVDSIHTNISNGSVLVHCEMGIQRSPAVVSFYMMKYNNMSADESISYVTSKHPNSFKHRVTFLEALYRLENK